MSLRGLITRGVGAVVGRKVAEETGNSGAIGGMLGFGLAMLARRSPLGLATVGAIIVGKKIYDAKTAREVQPALPLEGGGTNEAALDRFVDDPAERDGPSAAADARDPAHAAQA